MKHTIDQDEELSLEPYLVVRFSFECTVDAIADVRWGVLVNDGKLGETEIQRKVGAFLAGLNEAELIQAANRVFEDWAAQDALDGLRVETTRRRLG